MPWCAVWMERASDRQPFEASPGSGRSCNLVQAQLLQQCFPFHYYLSPDRVCFGSDESSRTSTPCIPCTAISCQWDPSSRSPRPSEYCHSAPSSVPAAPAADPGQATWVAATGNSPTSRAPPKSACSTTQANRVLLAIRLGHGACQGDSLPLAPMQSRQPDERLLWGICNISNIARTSSAWLSDSFSGPSSEAGVAPEASSDT